MKLLVLGGTEFVGRHAVRAALARGHELTLFNRGMTNPGLFPEAEHLRGDRETQAGLATLSRRRWDAALDTCGYVPRVVRASADALAGAVDHYAFISSLSVYPDERTVGLDESAPVAEIDDPSTEEVTDETYGPLKALCEREVQGAFGDRALVIRPGYIVGPHDPSDRFTYWPHRVARGGEMLTPDPGYRMQVIDARDLGEWWVRLAERRVGDVFNAVGPQGTLVFGEVLEAARLASGAEPTTVSPDAAWLLDQGVDDADLPLWHPPEEEAGAMAVATSKAAATGLTHRPIGEIVRDTLRWGSTQPAGRPLAAGMNPERERSLLHRWRELAGR
jgi:2'-hydroxyisoflavone reductase